MFKINLLVIAILQIFFLSCSSSKRTATYSGEELPITTSYARDSVVSKNNVTPSPTKYDPIQIKYGRYLHVDPNEITNGSLYHFIDKWLNTPYKWGGMDANGIDCSAFLQRLLAEVYMIRIPRTSVEQFFAERIERFKSADYLSEGDLVFFRTMENKVISHVGLYLHNNMFVNSSSSKGVSIASLNDPYWKKRFVAAGRLKTDPQAK